MATLYRAADAGSIKNVRRLLLKGKEDMNLQNSRTGQTPLHCACRHGHAEIVAAFLEAGADMERAQHQGETPLIAAALGGHIEVVL